LRALLSHEERARAARFHFPAHARRFVVAHGRLRQALAPVVGVAPGQIEFATGAHGKPVLAGRAAASGIHFNLSHSDALGLVGWARGRELGVDVETWRQTSDEAALVRRFFSPVEIAAYEALPAQSRREGFFNCWTRKEAYVKAVGRGLGLALDSFDVSMDAGPGARLLRPSASCADGRCWSLAAPPCGAGVSLAVVLEADNLLLIPA
jgi:4'-phosphopantetheinyl transferase